MYDDRHFKGHKVRHVVIEGDPWFVAVDVCRALGMSVAGGTFQWLTGLKPKEQWLLRKKDALEHQYLNHGCCMELFPAGSPVACTKLISESGLYKLIMRSDKPIAFAFQDWVTQEVLPAIRRTGDERGWRRERMVESVQPQERWILRKRDYVKDPRFILGSMAQMFGPTDSVITLERIKAILHISGPRRSWPYDVQ